MCGSASLSCRVGAQTRTLPRRDLVLPKVLQYEPNLRVHALPTVVHRPAESVFLRITEWFHPLSSNWYFVHL